MESIFNLLKIRSYLDKEEWVDDDYENDRQKRSFFYGSVFLNLPSGKYYMPWCCSNVTEEEVNKDIEWYEQAENELVTIGCFIESGEGDPCDLFISEYRDCI